MKKTADNFISRAFELYKKAVPNPAVQAALLGGVGYLGTRLAWNPVVETVRSLARPFGKAHYKLSDEEWDMAMDNLKYDSGLKKWLPIAVGALGAGASAMATYTPFERFGGFLKWNDTSSGYTRKKNPFIIPSLGKTGSLVKTASDFSYDGYIPELDLSKPINAHTAESLFTNDPYLINQPYVRNLGTSIVTSAAQTTGTNNPTLGSIFDSAVNKIDKKLTFGGVTSTGIKSVVSNGVARLFTGVLDTMIGLEPDTKRNIVDAGTWAGTIAAILD